MKFQCVKKYAMPFKFDLRGDLLRHASLDAAKRAVREAEPRDDPKALAAARRELRDAAGVEVDRLTRERVAAQPGTRYSDALRDTLKSDPALANAYNGEAG